MKKERTSVQVDEGLEKKGERTAVTYMILALRSKWKNSRFNNNSNSYKLLKALFTTIPKTKP